MATNEAPQSDMETQVEIFFNNVINGGTDTTNMPEDLLDDLNDTDYRIFIGLFCKRLREYLEKYDAQAIRDYNYNCDGDRQFITAVINDNVDDAIDWGIKLTPNGNPRMMTYAIVNLIAYLKNAKDSAKSESKITRRKMLGVIGAAIGLPVAAYVAGQTGAYIAEKQIEGNERERLLKDAQREEMQDDELLRSAEQSAHLIHVTDTWKPVLEANKNILLQSLERAKQRKYESAIIANRYYRYGRLCQLLGENRQAQEAYGQALKLDSNHELAKYWSRTIEK